MSSNRRYTLSLSCPDRVGIVAAVSSFLAQHKGWITEASHHADPEAMRFFMRQEILADSLPFGIAAFRDKFFPIAREFDIEPDASSASYPLAAAAICGGRVCVPGLTDQSLQGDAAFCHVLARMGCDVTQDATGTTVSRSGPLRGLAINMVDLSDLVPTLAAVAAFADATTDIYGVGFIRNKESDRLTDLCLELRKAGVDAQDYPDGLIVQPSQAHSATLATHHDHRLAMAFALVGLGASGIIVEDPDVVSKSWPDFWTMIESLR